MCARTAVKKILKLSATGAQGYNHYSIIDGSDEKQIKAEAYKEFAERLKERKTQSTMDKRICTNEMIDNLLKEMVGEE